MIRLLLRSLSGTAVVVGLVLLVSGDAVPPGAEASFPGENGKIAYTPFSSFTGIRTINPDGTGDAPLIGDGAIGPAWSPDGKRIAFIRQADGGPQVWIADADGSDQQLVVEHGSSPSWSPDGKKIIYTRYTGQGSGLEPGLSVVNVENGPPFTPVSFTDSGTQDFSPEWSPDGTQIMFMRFGLVSFEYEVLWVINVDGSGLHRVAVGYNSVGVSSWSPDGAEVVLDARKGDIDSGDEGVFVFNLTNGDARKIREYGESNSDLSWSPDGKRIAFTAGDNTLQTMDPQGGDIRTVVAGGLSAAWQPDSGIVHSVEFTQAIQELQTVSELKSDLEADGAPPVPIVAGKPAVLRVYFREPDQDTDYLLDTNIHEADIQVTIETGCTPVRQRRNDNDCESADIYFVPPEGPWTAEIVVRDPATAEVLQELEFDLNSKRSAPIVLASVETCHAKDQNGIWECGEADLVPGLAASFLQHVAPTHDVHVVDTGAQIARLEGNNSNAWWLRILSGLDAMSAAYALSTDPPGEIRYYWGAVLPEEEGGPGGPNGRGYQPGFAAAGRTRTNIDGVDRADSTLAHEVAHNFGVRHTDKNQPLSDTPGCFGDVGLGTDWLYPDNFLYSGPPPGTLETGFDVVEGTAKQGDEHFELMGYCAPRWISQRSYLQMLDRLDGIAAAVPASVSTGDFWLVAGAITETAIDFQPLFQMSDTAGDTSAGSGSHRIEVQGPTGEVLFVRNLEPAHAGTDLGPDDEPVPETPVFSELVPVQAGATRIAVLAGATELGALDLAGIPPVVAFAQTPSSPAADQQTVSWTIVDADSSAHTSWLEHSGDNGATWHPIAFALEDSEWLTDFSELAGSNSSLMRVRVSDGVNTAEATFGPFVIAEKAPETSIVTPETGATFDEGQVVWLQAHAQDPEDGTLTGASVRWVSSRDGDLGSGQSLPLTDLSPGHHTITVTARDSDNNAVTATITLVVGDSSGDPHTWGDNDCDGEITSRDNQALQRRILQQPPLSQTQPCPALGDVVDVSGIGDKQWGDLDCDGEITSRDNQAMLRKVLQQPALSQTQPCPLLGDPVTTVGAAAITGWKHPSERWRLE